MFDTNIFRLVLCIYYLPYSVYKAFFISSFFQDYIGMYKHYLLFIYIVLCKYSLKIM